MTDTNSLSWFQGVQRVAADVSGMKIVHGVTAPTAGAGASAVVRPATEQLVDLPAVVLGYGGGKVVPSTWERQTHTLSGAIWRARDPLGESYDQLVADVGRVLNAFPPRARGYGVSAELQSVLVTSIGAIDGLEWPANSNRWFLVLPFELEVVVARAVNYVAA